MSMQNVLIEAWTGAARLSDSDGSKASPPAYPMEDTCRSSFRVIDSLLLKKKSLGVDFFFWEVISYTHGRPNKFLPRGWNDHPERYF
ncbi:hypothetical protein Pst134EA_029060 [Puccinia striiformis f. sp. tritici]|uniref:hypothetical protein n=1 Tax=Puccinia striiformis f. sp. tritici TaxID=168172 RepID=UPI002007B160|nr:hypothetical protein Pst134EA_029060 [Puccinia striiformis f. sp. tritici]KAH9447075.1 hypothetical protein Pst134EA_029060 [Puccinia striiformis f. sp. tritici]